jgi:hypothetical protein
VTPTHARLHALFSRILAVTTGTGIAVACGGAVDDGAWSNDPAQPRSLCGDDRPRYFPSGLIAAPRQDYVAARTESAFLSDAENFRANDTLHEGEPCATARSKASCRARLEGFRLLPLDRAGCEAAYPNVVHPGGTRGGCRVSYVLFTRGDEIGVAVTDADVRTLIGPIDSVQEAEWWLQRSYEPMCTRAPVSSFTVRELAGGYEFVFVANCEKNGLVHKVFVARDGQVVDRGTARAPEGTEFSCAVAGRRPEGFEARARSFYGRMAELEAASIGAFRRLERELRALGAPDELVRRVRSAIRDEIRHTRAMRTLAGARPIGKARGSAPLRTREEVALDNAREGGVRETFGALLAWHQAEHAEDASVREAMGAIAHDETAHAALALDVGAWLERGLDERAREAVARARAEAFSALHDELTEPIDETFARTNGLPTPRVALAMLEQVRVTLAPAST